MGLKPSGRTERINCKVSPEILSEIRLQLMIHNGRSTAEPWNLTDFLLSAIKFYLNDLRRKRAGSARRAQRRKADRQRMPEPDPLSEHNNRQKETSEAQQSGRINPWILETHGVTSNGIQPNGRDNGAPDGGSAARDEESPQP